jgi:hypothetical protein
MPTPVVVARLLRGGDFLARHPGQSLQGLKPKFPRRLNVAAEAATDKDLLQYEFCCNFAA